MIQRELNQAIITALRESQKVIVLLGPRQVGKTTLIKSIVERFKGENVLELNGDFVDDQERLSARRPSLNTLMKGVEFLFIDEAQSIPEIGKILKTYTRRISISACCGYRLFSI